MEAQLSLKAALPLAERIATASDRRNKTGPSEVIMVLHLSCTNPSIWWGQVVTLPANCYCFKSLLVIGYFLKRILVGYVRNLLLLAKGDSSRKSCLQNQPQITSFLYMYIFITFMAISLNLVFYSLHSVHNQNSLNHLFSEKNDDWLLGIGSIFKQINEP